MPEKMPADIARRCIESGIGVEVRTKGTQTQTKAKPKTKKKTIRRSAKKTGSKR